MTEVPQKTQSSTAMITVEEYMVRQGQALTAYTQVFGAVTKLTLETKVKVGLLTPELAEGIQKSIGDNLMAYLRQVEARMQAKLAETQQAPVFYDAKIPEATQAALGGTKASVPNAGPPVFEKHLRAQ